MSEKYNHNRPSSDFLADIDMLKSYGYNPIAVTQMMLEDTFVFETDEEAESAYQRFEAYVNRISGWWYGKNEFLEAVKEYQKENDVQVLVYWL